MIDTHCHLTFPDFADSIERTLADAATHGVRGAITISTTTRDCLEALAIAERFPNVWCTSGIHPLHSHEGPHEWANLERVARAPRCVAWGELGLDNHYDQPTRDVQRSVLDEHLAFIERTHADPTFGAPKPIVIHCREAFADLIPVLRRARLEPGRFVFHCFTGNSEDMRLILDFGAWVSFTGVLTYRNAAEVRAAAALVPLDRMMIETDAPFLSPDPHRGIRPCAPWMASVTARRLAEVKGVAWPEFQGILDDNTRRFFGIEVP